MEKKDLGFEDIIRKLNADNNTDNDDKVPNNIDISFYKSLVLHIISLPPKQYTLLSSFIGILLINGLDAKEQIILGKFISNIGHTILTSAAQEQLNIIKDKEI